jgi:hypothetical protein
MLVNLFEFLLFSTSYFTSRPCRARNSNYVDGLIVKREGEAVSLKFVVITGANSQPVLR